MVTTRSSARGADVRPGAPKDSFALYLREIAGHPLIGPGEEAELARRIRTGDRAALDQMVVANLRFVVAVAKRYRHLGVPLPDLVTEGNVGLLRAARRFDERKGVRFTSYAIWWVRQSILGAIRQQAGIVRLPSRHRMPADDVPLPPSLTVSVPGVSPHPVPLQSGDHGPRRGVRYLSLDAPPAAREGPPLAERLALEPKNDPADRVHRAALRDLIDASLTLLDEREATVLRLYFGLGDGESLSLAEIGARLAVSKERVRQIRERALVRLRHGVRRRDLESYHR